MKPDFLKWWLVAVLVGVGLWFGDNWGWWRGVKFAAESLARPGLVFVGWGESGLRQLVSLPKTAWESGRRVADLERQVAQLHVDASRVKSLQQENLELRKLAGVAEDRSKSWLVTRAIGGADEWWVDKGSNDGVKEGVAVVSGEQILIGKIVRAGEVMSNVVLVGSDNWRVAVITDRGAAGVLIKKAQGLMVEEIVQKDQLEEADIVMTRGEDMVPGGLVIGKVSKVLSVPAEVYKGAQVEALAKLKSLDYVFVLQAP